MKSTKPIALAALAVAGAASAQSSVTLFGVLDTAVSAYSNRSVDPNHATLASPLYIHKGSVKASRTALTNSNLASSRLGFRGTEDLGGGLALGFWLESGVNTDDGSGTGAGGSMAFNRRSTVSLSGPFGEVRLGRDYTPIFWNDAVFDPFAALGAGTNLIFTANTFNTAGGPGGFGGNPSYNRASNTVGYFLPPNLGGFHGQLLYGFHEQTKYDPGIATPNVANNSRTGRYVGGRFGYAAGPLDIAIAYGQSTTADQYFAGTTDAVKTLNLGASYDFGPVKLFAEVSRSRSERDHAVRPLTAAGDRELSGYLLGLTVPVGAGLIRAAYSHVSYDDNNNALPAAVNDPTASKLALGYVHHLSKRTALYATLARVNNRHGAALTAGGPAFVSNATFAPKNSRGYDLGIRHTF